MANAGAKLSSFPEVNDIQTGDMFPLLSGGNTNAKIDYTTLADAIIAKLKSEAGDGVLSINGKTGAVTINKSDVGLDNVDNTSDADKPVSTAVQNALDGKANNSVATSSADGLMSKADKAKLDGIGTGSNVKSVNGKTGAVTLAKGDVGLGSVVNLDQSKAIKSITRSGTTFTATALDGTTTTFTQQDSNTTYGVATSSTDGLMSKTDKAKLDGISSGADAVTIKTVKVNGTALTPDSDKAVNVTVPTLANNATTTAGGMALDARMGKTLADQASQFAKNTAQIETAGTATNAHSVGEYVMISNALYKVTASVAKGDTWAIGTNVTAANIGSEIGSLKSDLANKLYPVGSIYMSVNPTDPAELFGGTWERIKDRFLLAAGNTYAAGDSGGSASHSHTLSNNGAACIGNFDNVTAFLTGYKYYWKDYDSGSNMWAWTHNDNYQFTSSTNYYNDGIFVSLTGSTDMTNSMPPYLAVYMWKRIA